MLEKKYYRVLTIVTLTIFILFTLTLEYSFAQEENPLLKAQGLYKQGNFIEAVKVLEKFIENIKFNTNEKQRLADAYFLLARIYFDAGEEQSRIVGYLKKALQADARVGQNDPVMAALLEQARSAMSAPPLPKDKSFDGTMRRGDELFVAGDFIAAREQYRLAWRLDPDDPVAPEKISLCDERLKQEEQKKKLEERKLELSVQEKKFLDYLARGDVEASQGQGAFALKYFKAALKILPERDQEIAVHMDAVRARDPKAWETFMSESGPEMKTLMFKYFLFEMVTVPGGSFMMGSDSTEAFGNEKPVHKVTIAPFRIGKYEVTQGQWKAVMGGNPSGLPNGDDHPVESVSWADVQIFIQKVNAMTGNRYRLPTEAEWEYACRAGSIDERYGSLEAIAWYSSNSNKTTRPVGQKEANAWGLHDMLGNVWEWCQDVYGSYSVGVQSNIMNSVMGASRVYRGAGFKDDARNVRASCRQRDAGYRYTHLGFRLAMDK